MKTKIILFMVIAILFSLVGVFSITQDPRTLNNVWYYAPNYTNCVEIRNVGGNPAPLYGHCENSYFFVFTNKSNGDITIQIVPAPNTTCYFNNENCPSSQYLRNMTFRVNRIGTSLWGWFYFGGKVTNHSVDVSSCWNWWNTTDEEIRKYQRSFCPKTTIPFGIFDGGATFEPYWSTLQNPFGTALPDAYIVFNGYGGNYVNVDEKIYSERGLNVLNAIQNFNNICVSFWRIFYYISILLVILGIFFMIFGVLPLGLRWIIKKVIED